MLECRCSEADVWLHPIKHHLFILLYPISCLDCIWDRIFCLNCYLVHWSFYFFMCCLSAVASSLIRVISTHNINTNKHVSTWSTRDPIEKQANRHTNNIQCCRLNNTHNSIVHSIQISEYRKRDTGLYSKKKRNKAPHANRPRSAESNDEFLSPSSHSWDKNKKNNRSTKRARSPELNHFLCVLSMVWCLLWRFRVLTTNRAKSSGSRVQRAIDHHQCPLCVWGIFSNTERNGFAVFFAKDEGINSTVHREQYRLRFMHVK
jgi:hypothetical protein